MHSSLVTNMAVWNTYSKLISLCVLLLMVTLPTVQPSSTTERPSGDDSSSSSSDSSSDSSDISSESSDSSSGSRLLDRLMSGLPAIQAFWTGGENSAAYSNVATPENATVYPDGVWFGEQDLACVGGILAARRLRADQREHRRQVGRSWWQRWMRRTRRDTTNTEGDSVLVDTSNNQTATVDFLDVFEPVHSLVYFRGEYYEWGIPGTVSHWRSVIPYVPQCPIVWQSEPAVQASQCTTENAVAFTDTYTATYGPYNLISNNCHYYANRLVAVLADEACVETEGMREMLTKHVVDRAMARMRCGLFC